jgi:5-bromo-4-chloroindolyl phosphate hydrolysis protein
MKINALGEIGTRKSNTAIIRTNLEMKNNPLGKIDTINEQEKNIKNATQITSCLQFSPLKFKSDKIVPQTNKKLHFGHSVSQHRQNGWKIQIEIFF